MKKEKTSTARYGAYTLTCDDCGGICFYGEDGKLRCAKCKSVIVYA